MSVVGNNAPPVAIEESLLRRARKMVEKVGSLALRNPIWLSLLIAVAFFAWQSPHFLSLFNLSNILLQAAFFGFLAIGLTFVIVSGHIDLSVGSLVGLTAGLSVVLQPLLGLPLAILAGLGTGAVVGLLNGLFVERIGINSLIVTLAMMIGLKGLTFAVVGEDSIIVESQFLTDLGGLRIASFHLITLVFLVLLALAQWVLSSTRHGREAYAIGGNRTAAENAGIRVSRHVILNFVLSGFLAALCGLAIAASMGAAVPTYGQGYESWAIAAVALGGAKLTGGSGSAINALGGVLLLAVLRNGLNLVHVSAHYVLVVIGLALFVALLVEKRSGGLLFPIDFTLNKKK